MTSGDGITNSRPDRPPQSAVGSGGFRIRPSSERDHRWVADFVAEHWGASTLVTRGRLYHANQLPGFIAEKDGQPIGLITYQRDGDQCEVTSLNSVRERIGVGSALLAAVQTAAVEAGCRRLWLITTNDNLAAIRFYQRRGWRLVAVYPNAMDESRRLKPEIPTIGIDGIPIRDEIELEFPL